MQPEDYVAALYRHVLGRGADDAGLAYFSELMRAGADPTEILHSLLTSDEYAMRHDRRTDETVWRRALPLLDERGLTIVDVGAQMLDYEGHVYAPLLREEIRHQVIGFEPLADRVAARRVKEAGQALILHPDAVGDGAVHVLHINNDDATSSLYPLNRALMAGFEHLHTLYEVERMELTTRRLDDILPAGPVDFLKLDIQGGEMLALSGAERTLETTCVIHCEVEFAALYEGQPLFSEIHDFLATRGFVLIDLLMPHRYAYLNQAGVDGRDRLLWGEAIFMRDCDEVATLAAQTIIAALVYDKPSLAQHLHDRCQASRHGAIA